MSFTQPSITRYYTNSRLFSIDLGKSKDKRDRTSNDFTFCDFFFVESEMVNDLTYIIRTYYIIMIIGSPYNIE